MWACMCPVWGENRRGEWCRLHTLCLHPPPRQVSGRDDCSSCTDMSPTTLPPPPIPSSLLSPVVWCHGSWCWRTPMACCKLELKGRFNFSDSAWTVVVVLSVPTPPPLPVTPSLLQSCRGCCVIQAALQTLDWHWLLSFLLHPGSLCFFAEHRTAVWWIPIDPLNRPRNSSVHQASVCWPRQHSTYKVDGLLCHTPHYCKWDERSLAVTPPPYSISLHRIYLNTV